MSSVARDRLRTAVVTAALLACACDGARDGSFHLYGASRSSQQLWHVEVLERTDGLALERRGTHALGFAPNPIVGHPTLPVLYLSSVSALPGPAPRLLRVGLDDSRPVRFDAREAPADYAFLHVDRSARGLFAASYRSGRVDVFDLDPAGVIGEQRAPRAEVSPYAHSVVTSPDGRFAYVALVRDSNAILQYGIDAASGGLVPLVPPGAPVPERAGPRHLAFHPHLPVVYASNEQRLGVSVYRQRPTGQLDLVQLEGAISAETDPRGRSGSSLVVTPDGRFLFSGVRAARAERNAIARYRIDERGELEALGHTRTSPLPWALALAPGGGTLLVSATGEAVLLAYGIGEGGELTLRARLEWDEGIRSIVTR